MNRKLFCQIFILAYLALFLSLGRAGGGDDVTVYKTVGTGATNLVVTSSNTTAGTTLELFHAETPVRIYLSGVGTPSTTNGSLIAKISTSFDSNTWDTAASSNIKLTMSTMNGATNWVIVNTISDWFQTGGAKYLRVGQLENTFQGSVSNISVTIAYPAP